MKTDNREKSQLKILIIAIIFYFAMLRIDSIIAFACSLLNLAKPFIAGGIIAFIINVPMVRTEKLIEKTKLKKYRRGIAFILTVLILFAAAAAFLLIVLPQLSQTVTTLIVRIQRLLDKIPLILADHSENLSFIEEYIAGLEIDWHDAGQKLIAWLQGFAVAVVGSGSDIVSSVFSGFTTAVFSVIFAIYLLMGKEKNTAALNRFSKAVLGEKISSAINHVLSLCYRNFSGFLSGQCLEAVILGTMFVVSMTLLRIPYAFLIGVIIAVTALIPVFGAFIGCIIGIVLIAIESPVKAAVFLVLFLILQQIEGNVIYPRVVGNSVGLPSILVFMSVILGNSLMGVAGMLIFIPAVSVLYTLLKEFVVQKENSR